MRIQIKCLRPSAVVPGYMTEHAAGMDLAAAGGEEIVLLPGERRLIPTGIAVAIPPGHEGQVRPRSGLAQKYGVTCLNAPGTIDADYRGEIQVLLVNHGQEPFVVRPRERIAQLVIAPICRAEIDEVQTLADTQRGPGGFGSTGTATP